MKIQKTEGGWRLEITDAQAKLIYDHVAVKKLVGNLALGTDVLDELGVLLACEMEKQTQKPKK